MPNHLIRMSAAASLKKGLVSSENYELERTMVCIVFLTNVTISF